eukprot:CAMPEP_0170264462 /NCGR_PEP_ID=MMETSP0116_2-20130129/32126_1 /TAXON_ID=400756 /ORGANISM="Durinskia baltica, Strain CSIRO CS-38" /LENGTH=424 /DNA_ID=CAMNT_0010515555 /DNA_START=60 /DNA_END=1335 /DNA_ORIENTATION=-
MGVIFEDGQARRSLHSSDTDHDAACAPLESRDFFKTLRTYEAFRKGLECPPEERLPASTQRKYSLNVHMLSLDESEAAYGNMRVPRMRVLKTLHIALQWRTALASTLPTALTLMTLSGVCATVSTLLGDFASEYWYWTLAQCAQEVGVLIRSLQAAVSLLLSFYALNRIAWFWRMMKAGWRLQGRIHDIGLIVGANYGHTEEDFEAMYVLYRHLMFASSSASSRSRPSDFKFVGYVPLIECGLLTKSEGVIISSAHSGPRTVAEAWVSAWISHHIDDWSARQQAMQRLCEMRVVDMMDERAPVSFESLLYLCVYAFCFLLPFGPATVDDEQRHRASVCAWLLVKVFSDGAVIAFNLSLLHLLYHIQAPFDSIGMPHDCLNPIAIMLSTEKKLRDYLTAEVSPSLPPRRMPSGIETWSESRFVVL